VYFTPNRYYIVLSIEFSYPRISSSKRPSFTYLDLLERSCRLEGSCAYIDLVDTVDYVDLEDLEILKSVNCIH
jgi:hypothetical protein